MDPRRASLEQGAALSGGVLDAGLDDRLGVARRSVQLRQQGVRDPGAAHLREALDLSGVGDGHDAGDNGRIDVFRPYPRYELEVVALIEEELGDDEVAARVDLALEIAQVVLGARRLGMHLGVAGAADTEVLALADEGDELIGVREPLGVGDERRVPPRRVAPQRHDVLDTGVLVLVQQLSDLVPAVPYAGEMGHGLDAGFTLDPLSDGDGLFAGAAAGPVGDGDESRPQRFEVGHGLEQRVDAAVILGRKELEGEEWLFPAEALLDLHPPCSPSASRNARQTRSGVSGRSQISAPVA